MKNPKQIAANASVSDYHFSYSPLSSHSFKTRSILRIQCSSISTFSA